MRNRFAILIASIVALSAVAVVAQGQGNRVAVSIPGFGTFVVKKVAAREGRNPKTGESIQIPAHRRVAFRAGKGLKSRVAD